MSKHFNPDTVWMEDRETTSSSNDIKSREASFKRKPPQLSKMREAAKAMKDEPSLEKNLAEVYFVVYSQVEKEEQKRDVKREN